MQEVNELLTKNSEGFLFELSSQLDQILEYQLSYYFHSRNFLTCDLLLFVIMLIIMFFRDKNDLKSVIFFNINYF